MKIYACLILLIISLVQFTPPLYAKEINQFITLVNPVRISTYSINPGQSLSNQYNQIKLRNLPASWLLTYDVLSNNDLVEQVKRMDPQQDIGILLEVTPEYAQKSGVDYQKKDSWHRASSIFLSGYTQEERTKLIDTVFELFKAKFGYYPKSVGSWWTDSFSLELMRQKYGITANLGCADQFATDGYQIWGTYFSTPYYPSLHHAGIPASSIDSKLDVVTLQWAQRDPLNGYLTPQDKRASLYSSQDYFTLNLNQDYFEKLVKLYINKKDNQFGQITLGLEGDFEPGTYLGGSFIDTLDLAKRFNDEGLVTVTQMQQFAKFYKNTFPEVSPPQTIISDDLLGSQKKVIWYQSPFYRVGIEVNLQMHTASIIDLRFYSPDLYEPFYKAKNQSLDLEINTPSLIDTVSNPNERWQIASSDLTNYYSKSGILTIEFSDQNKLELGQKTINFTKVVSDVPNVFYSYPGVKTTKSNNGIKIEFTDRWLTNTKGVEIKQVSPQIKIFLLHKKKVIVSSVAVLFILSLLFLFFKSNVQSFYKGGMVSFLICLFLWAIFVQKFTIFSKYYISQDEIQGLIKLKSYPEGRVLIYNGICFICQYEKDLIPAVYFNIRNQVANISHKKTISDETVITTQDKLHLTEQKYSREELKKWLQGKEIQYIFLEKYGNYQEILPYSPGDLGVKKVFGNANSEIWMVVN